MNGEERNLTLQNAVLEWQKKYGIRDGDPMLASLMSGKVIPVAEVTQRYAAWALEQFNGHRGHTAAALDISPKTLSAWLREKS